MSRRKAFAFTEAYNDPIIVEIHVPRNTNAIFMPQVNQGSISSHELELLLNKSNKFRIISKGTIKGEGRWHGEILPKYVLEVVK